MFVTVVKLSYHVDKDQNITFEQQNFHRNSSTVENIHCEIPKAKGQYFQKYNVDEERCYHKVIKT